MGPGDDCGDARLSPGAFFRGGLPCGSDGGCLAPARDGAVLAVCGSGAGAEGISVRAEGMIYRMEGMIYRVDGMIYRMEGMIYRMEGMIYRMEGMIYRMEEMIYRMGGWKISFF